MDAIRAVHSGKKTLSPEVSYELAEHSTDDALTPAEISVLKLIAARNANKHIADQLSISEDTVKWRVKNILSKLGAHDRTHAAMIGLKRGIIEVYTPLPQSFSQRPPKRVDTTLSLEFAPNSKFPRTNSATKQKCLLRRLFSTFAQGWPGVGLLLMRVVLGFALIGVRLHGCPAILRPM